MIRSRPILLLTRPLPQSERFAEQCRSRFGADIQIILSPLIRIEGLNPTVPPEPYCGLIFTSENGVRFLPAGMAAKGTPAFCVGDRTATAARKAGLAVFSARGSAADLVRLVLANAPDGRLVHIRGDHTRGDVATRLAGAGYAVDELICYRQIMQPLTQQARAALDGDLPVILPLFSPRTARQLGREVNQSRAPVRYVAISEAVAEELSDTDPAQIVIAARPDAAAVLVELQGLIDA